MRGHIWWTGFWHKHLCQLDGSSLLPGTLSQIGIRWRPAPPLFSRLGERESGEEEEEEIAKKNSYWCLFSGGKKSMALVQWKKNLIALLWEKMNTPACRTSRKSIGCWTPLSNSFDLDPATLTLTLRPLTFVTLTLLSWPWYWTTFSETRTRSKTWILTFLTLVTLTYDLVLWTWPRYHGP